MAATMASTSSLNRSDDDFVARMLAFEASWAAGPVSQHINDAGAFGTSQKQNTAPAQAGSRDEAVSASVATSAELIRAAQIICFASVFSAVAQP